MPLPEEHRPPQAASLKQLNAAAATVAQKLGLRLTTPQAQDLREEAPIVGYLKLRWFFETAQGHPWGHLTLKCEGGYGAGRGKGPGWFKGAVEVLRDGQGLPLLSETLVSQWDYPNDGRASVKHTRLGLVAWAKNLDVSPETGLVASEPPSSKRPRP